MAPFWLAVFVQLVVEAVEAFVVEQILVADMELALVVLAGICSFVDVRRIVVVDELVALESTAVVVVSLVANFVTD